MVFFLLRIRLHSSLGPAAPAQWKEPGLGRWKQTQQNDSQPSCAFSSCVTGKLLGLLGICGTGITPTAEVTGSHTQHILVKA